MSGHQKTAVVDFDNTVSGYDRWRGPGVMGPIIPYARDALEELREWGWRVVVFTTRGSFAAVCDWLDASGLGWCEVNSTAHNPPGCSQKPIGEVYFDDRDAHCVGGMPYNWHWAMSRVRNRYQPESAGDLLPEASEWARWWIRYFVAPGVRRQFAADLPLQLDLIKLRAEGKHELANQIEREAFADPQGM